MSKLFFASALCVALVGGLAAQAPAPQAPAESSLKAGDKAPDFSLPGTDGKTHKLADYKAQLDKSKSALEEM